MFTFRVAGHEMRQHIAVKTFRTTQLSDSVMRNTSVEQCFYADFKTSLDMHYLSRVLESQCDGSGGLEVIEETRGKTGAMVCEWKGRNK